MATENPTGGDDAATDDGRIGGDPIDGDGTYPYAGLTRYDDSEDVDVVTLPEQVERDTSSMRYWAMNQAGAHEIGDGAGAEREDIDPEVLPERGLHTLVPELPRAAEADVAWVHPRTGEVLETMKHNAVINPDRAERVEWGYGNIAEVVADVTSHSEDEAKAVLSEMSRDDALDELCTPEQREQVEETVTGDDALYHIPTSDYTIINPASFLDPLCEVIRDRDLNDKVFGEVHLDRGGGRATLDLYMDGKHVESPVFDDDREPVVCGLQVQWDFFGDWAVRACGQALDWSCTNRIQRMTDREIVKHAGDVEERQDWYDWFDGLIDRLDEKRDHLARLIQQAEEMTLDFEDLPNDIEAEFREMDAAPWTALYGYMGLPDYLAEHAGRRLQSQAEDPYEPNWWEIHSAGTYAVTHEARGNRIGGGAVEDYARTANEMLFNPANMEERMVENYEADRMDDDQDTLDVEGGGVADIRNAFEPVAEKREQYEEWEEELADMGVEL